MVVFLQVYPEEEQSHQADSWYIAGKVDSVYTTNIGSQINDCTIADGSPETAWIDDSPKGTLPTITLWFSGACPMITQVSIFNGNVYTKDCWEEYGRAKRIRLVY